VVHVAGRDAIILPAKHLNSVWATKLTFSVISFSSLLHPLFLSIDNGTTTLQTTRTLYNNFEQQTQGNSLLLTLLSIYDD
jgi:hypothetical protein